jgi:hypothetical protein
MHIEVADNTPDTRRRIDAGFTRWGNAFDEAHPIDHFRSTFRARLTEPSAFPIYRPTYGGGSSEVTGWLLVTPEQGHRR